MSMTKKQKQEANARRREKYQSDPAYRARQVEQARAYYRKGTKVKKTDCLSNLNILSEIGTVRMVRPLTQSKKPFKALTFTNPEMAKALKLTPAAFHKWQKSGRIPEPRFKLVFEEGPDNPERQVQRVYLEKEVKVILKIVGEHQKEFRHYRSSHTETMERIKDALTKIRKGAK